LFVLILLSMTVLAVALPGPSVTADVAGEEAQLLDLINQERASRNIATLNLHPSLFQVAKNYSREMMEHSFLSHVSQVDGSTIWDRIRRSGYYDGYQGQIVIRENIALISGPAAAVVAHQSLMNSEGHRENLLASDVNEIGIGITEGAFQSVSSAIYVEVFAYHARDQQITLFASVSPITATVRRGEEATFRIHVKSSISTSVSIEVANLRPPLVWHLAKPSGTTPLDTVLTVDTISALEGTYSFDIIVKGGGQTRTLSLTLNVVSPTQTTTARTTTTATSSYTSTISGTTTTSTNITQTSTATTRTTETSSFTRRLTTMRCIIATAAFGSELSPEVQYLRQFRDEKVMSTFNGRMFMTAFNAAYYSSSPRMAAFVAEHIWAALAVRAVIYPLISLLRLSSLALNNSLIHRETAVLLCGLLASCLIGLIYVFPLAAILLLFVQSSTVGRFWTRSRRRKLLPSDEVQ